MLMKTSKYLVLVLFLFGLSGFAHAGSDTSFDVLVVPTLLDSEMDVWYKTPPDSAPAINAVSAVTKGQTFQIAVFFSRYQIDKKNNADITYDVQLKKPGGSPYFEQKGLKGYAGKTLRADVVLLCGNMVGVSFDPEDPWGDYTISVIAHDNIAKTSKSKSVKIMLSKWSLGEKPATFEDFDKWYQDYHVAPKPNEAVYAYLTHEPLQDKKGELAFAGLYFFKVVFVENKYLVDHLASRFEKATEEQQKKIILMLHWLNMLDKIKATPEEKAAYKAWASQVVLPDPYGETLSGGQQDMLWAEFFATGRIRPIRKLISNLEYSKYKGSIEAYKESKKTEEDKLNAYKDAVFQSAVWSLASNCKQHALVAKYCIYLHDNGKLSANEKSLLGVILSKVFSQDNEKEQPKHEQKNNRL